MVEYITRPEWGAKYGPNPLVPLPYGEVVVHTAAGAVRGVDASRASDVRTMQGIESFHRNSRGWKGGVGYNFVIMRSGRIFEGQGWGHRGTHTESRNSELGICFDGHGDNHPATDEQWAAAEWLIRKGLRTGRIVSRYKVSGHRDYSQKGKTCPGNLIYPHIGRLRGLTTAEPEDDDVPYSKWSDADKTAFWNDFKVYGAPVITGSLVTKPSEKQTNLGDLFNLIRGGK